MWECKRTNDQDGKSLGTVFLQKKLGKSVDEKKKREKRIWERNFSCEILLITVHLMTAAFYRIIMSTSCKQSLSFSDKPFMPFSGKSMRRFEKRVQDAIVSSKISKQENQRKYGDILIQCNFQISFIDYCSNASPSCIDLKTYVFYTQK